MRNCGQFYIDGRWVEPLGDAAALTITNPADEQATGKLALGTAADVDRAVEAAARAFPTFQRTTKAERLDLLRSLVARFTARYDDVAEAISAEMGAPLDLAHGAQTAIGLAHLEATIEALEHYVFEEQRGSTLIRREPIGVCGFITPWNWPINQIVCKVAPALACGCTMVLKASELAPFSAIVWSEICDAAGVPAGVYNLVQGDGPIAGAALAAHPLVDMISFTGSTAAGVEVARLAAPTVKRVHQELGGKSPHIVLDDDRLPESVRWGVRGVALNAGQNCNAPTRMLVPKARLDEAQAIAAEAASALRVGRPGDRPDVGPIISERHWTRIQSLLDEAVREGAELVAGGTGRPEGLEQGYFVKPTVFGRVHNDMMIAREEVFGPVVVMIAYDDIDDAIRIANDTPYGLAAYVSGRNEDELRELATQLRAGQVNINGAAPDYMAPFGGFKKSGNGREWGDHALAEFLETKAVLGHSSAKAK